MSVYHDEIEIEDFEYDEEEETYYYPCPCGDRFQITKVLMLRVAWQCLTMRFRTNNNYNIISGGAESWWRSCNVPQLFPDC